MTTIESFLAGFLVGVIGTLLLLYRHRKTNIPPGPSSTGTVPHTDEKAASSIAHDRGIEVFDD